jgi:hypothetical protein
MSPAVRTDSLQSRGDRGGLKQFLHYLVYLSQKWFYPYDLNSKSDIDSTPLCDDLITLKPFMSKIVKDKLTPHVVLIFLKRHNL